MCQPLDETKSEKIWRNRRENVVEWHHRFWTDNNLDFEKSKQIWQNNWLKETGNQPTSSDLSLFYKLYLDEAKDRHMEYNKRWWKENFAMLKPGFNGEFKRLIRWLTSPSRNGEHVVATIPVIKEEDQLQEKR